MGVFGALGMKRIMKSHCLFVRDLGEARTACDIIWLLSNCQPTSLHRATVLRDWEEGEEQSVGLLIHRRELFS